MRALSLFRQRMLSGSLLLFSCFSLFILYQININIWTNYTYQRFIDWIYLYGLGMAYVPQSSMTFDFLAFLMLGLLFFSSWKLFGLKWGVRALSLMVLLETSIVYFFDFREFNIHAVNLLPYPTNLQLFLGSIASLGLTGMKR